MSGCIKGRSFFAIARASLGTTLFIVVVVLGVAYGAMYYFDIQIDYVKYQDELVYSLAAFSSILFLYTLRKYYKKLRSFEQYLRISDISSFIVQHADEIGLTEDDKYIVEEVTTLMKRHDVDISAIKRCKKKDIIEAYKKTISSDDFRDMRRALKKANPVVATEMTDEEMDAMIDDLDARIGAGDQAKPLISLFFAKNARDLEITTDPDRAYEIFKELYNGSSGGMIHVYALETYSKSDVVDCYREQVEDPEFLALREETK